MKPFKAFLIVSFLFLFIFPVHSQTVTVNKLPNSIDGFVNLRNEIATSPEGGATILLLALKIYNANPELGHQCMVVALDKSFLTQGNVYKGYSMTAQKKNFVKTYLGRYKNIANSYIKGSSPENGYNVKLPYVFEYSTSSYSGDLGNGTYKLFVKCSGADSPRPITLKKNNRGIWKALNWNSLLVGIKKPASDEDDDI